MLHLISSTLQPNYTRIAEYCNLWRNYDDIQVPLFIDILALGNFDSLFVCHKLYV